MFHFELGKVRNDSRWIRDSVGMKQTSAQRSAESLPAALIVVEVVSEKGGVVSGWWSTDEMKSVGKEQSLRRREGVSREEIVDAAAMNERVEPGRAVRAEPMQPPFIRSVSPLQLCSSVGLYSLVPVLPGDCLRSRDCLKDFIVPFP